MIDALIVPLLSDKLNSVIVSQATAVRIPLLGALAGSFGKLTCPLMNHLRILYHCHPRIKISAE
jgi:hypothetical protein